ncbi:hypothetical protein GEV29_06520 [Aeromicrobium sp. SMF47]|uniref:Uncharacterized protein n=1 Tax=Aeromicrobium yanjiei TaxID=2662028 RepID=A0A5Q2MLC5_9ACTN|nr:MULTISPECIES: hypothetical protein [Aeromicrobium]MRJ76185.1 hypothetical protein [Aeromicrobium yanjiei]MRK00534.1 hypothetical protein [Aeromicrobium sp. S22]QGG42629.1 hypothetical protein GEV26_15280 [Aeromicrobium yanjiei]
MSDETPSPIQPSVEEVDAEVRAKLTGQSVSDIAQQAESAYATINVRLTGEQLADYADAVSNGAAFDITQAVERSS